MKISLKTGIWTQIEKLLKIIFFEKIINFLQLL